MLLQHTASWRSCNFLRSGPFPAPWDAHVLSHAVQHLNCLKGLLTQEPPCPCNDEFLYQVAGWGRLGTLVCPPAHAPIPSSFWDESCTVAAVERNHLPMLRWLRAQEPQCPWDIDCCTEAARIGSLGMLQWLRSQHPPCPWSDGCTWWTTTHGNLLMLRWLRAQSPPCPWSPHCTDEAARRGHLEILEWLCNQDLRLNGTEYYQAASGGRQHVLRLHAQHAPGPSFDSSYRSQISSPILMFLGDMGFPLRGHREALMVTSQTFCAFHGLLRWCCRAVSDPSRGADCAFELLAPDSSGQDLLVRLSQLAPDLSACIAVAAGLQHNIS